MQNTNKEYFAPEVKLIQIDNGISLALESEPPVGPNEVGELIRSELENPFKPSFT